MLSSARPVAIIVGGSSGIGAACARRFVQAGMDVALAARGQERLAATAAALSGTNTRVLAVVADATDEGGMRTFVSRALAAFGRLDVLVCSAGLGFPGRLDETSPEILQRILDVNVVGTLNAVRAVLPYFEAQRAGHIIAIGSMAGKRGIPGYAGYSATKFAQTGMLEALRAELAGSGVAVTTVFPVSVATEFHNAMAREFGVTSGGGGPRQTADDVARAVLRAIRSRAPEVYPLRRARLLVWINALWPRLADGIVRRYARTRTK
jgi:NADP-dependent 3-hydroxy acid dehydrogenase YdfG